MTSSKEEEQTTAPQEAAGDGEPNNIPKKKKKERVVITPPCPPSVSTGYMIIRSAIMGVIGVSNETSKFGTLQATYIKESPELTGKFNINLGKKLGTECQLDLSTNPNKRKEILLAIENACNRIINEGNNTNLYIFKNTKKQLIEKYGLGVLDSSHEKDKKCPPTKELICATLVSGSDDNNDVLLCIAVPPSIPYKSPTNNINKIIFDMNQSNITSGSRKAEIVIKFKVILKENSTDTELATELSKDDEQLPSCIPDTLKQMIIRMPEGKELLEKQEEKEKSSISSTKEIDEVTSKTADIAITTTTTTTTTTAQEGGSDDKNAADGSDEEEQKKGNNSDSKFFVSVEKVEGDIDYDKLVDQFGSKLITNDIMKTIENMTVGKGRVPSLHRFLRRNIFFSHRDLVALLEGIGQDGQQMYLYTGRGPSSSAMHLGHLIPFLFTKWLQKAFNCPLVIQMTDDEKFLFKGEYVNSEYGDNLNYYQSLTIENARDIIACDFDYNKTFIFSDLDYVGRMYPNIVRIWKSVTSNVVNNIFGFKGDANIGKVAFPAVQAAPSFASSFPIVLNTKDKRDTKMMCLIPCAIDQDPYFRMTRDISHKLVLNSKEHKLGGKPALIHSKFFPPLQGAHGKMSSSDTTSAIFLTDTPKEIEEKIKKYAFSGGQETKKQQEELGANLDIDVSYQWLRFFLEDDDELDEIGKSYGSGKGKYWSTGLVKNKLIDVLQKLVADHQERRSKITDEEVQKWMTERCILSSSSSSSS